MRVKAMRVLDLGIKGSLRFVDKGERLRQAEDKVTRLQEVAGVLLPRPTSASTTRRHMKSTGR